MESLHGGTLLDWESRKTVKPDWWRNSCLQSLSPWSVWFFCLGFLDWYGSLHQYIQVWRQIADNKRVEGEEAFEVVVEVSEGVIIKRSVKTLLTASCRLLQSLCYFVGSDFTLSVLRHIKPYSSSLLKPSSNINVYSPHGYLLGYPFHNRFYLTDNEDHRIYGY